MTPASVLVVEDDKAVRFGVCGGLRALGFRVAEADTCETAITGFCEDRPDVVVTDLMLPDGDALALLGRLKQIDPTIPVFIVTGHGSIDLAVKAVKQGAEDFITKPVDVKTLSELVKVAAVRTQRKRTGRRAKYGGPPAFTPRSSKMLRVEEQIEKLQSSDCSVLLLGETGTGKSVIARRVHAISDRKTKPFVDINCAGLSKDFVESELFGHERGAFTGAHATKPGLLDTANNGTLFLDEIGDVDITVQPKLLKVLEEKKFRRMGDVRERAVDVRLIGATHHDLIAAVAAKTFRADLYYRISTVFITMPSLRERREDIVPLAEFMMEDRASSDVELTPSAKQALLDHDWPGNLRELKNVIERALLQRTGSIIDACDVQFDTQSVRMLPAAAPSELTPTPSRRLSDVEREAIESALAAESGKVDAAAKRLGIPRSTLYQRIKDFGITRARRAR